jgi:hypothetical protein
MISVPSALPVWLPARLHIVPSLPLAILNDVVPVLAGLILSGGSVWLSLLSPILAALLGLLKELVGSLLQITSIHGILSLSDYNTTMSLNGERYSRS